MSQNRSETAISIIGGTGALGSGLALRWSQAGHRVTLGSRDAARAIEVAEGLSGRLRSAGSSRREASSCAAIAGMNNIDAAAAGEVVVLTVPYSHHQSTLTSIALALNGKILVDVTVPLVPPKVRTVQLPDAGSVAKGTQEFLGKDVRVVSAFQNVAAAHLVELDHNIDCDVLVCGNDPKAREQVIGLAADAGMRAWHAGRIDNSAVAEALTSTLIFINGHYKIDGAGLRITGQPGTRQDV